MIPRGRASRCGQFPGDVPASSLDRFRQTRLRGPRAAADRGRCRRACGPGGSPGSRPAPMTAARARRWLPARPCPRRLPRRPHASPGVIALRVSEPARRRRTPRRATAFPLRAQKPQGPFETTADSRSGAPAFRAARSSPAFPGENRRRPVVGTPRYRQPREGATPVPWCSHDQRASDVRVLVAGRNPCAPPSHPPAANRVSNAARPRLSAVLDRQTWRT